MPKGYYTLPGLQRALRALPKDLSDELRDASTDIATDIGTETRRRLELLGPQGTLVARSVKVRRDRVPVVQAGGTTRLRRGPNQTIGHVFFGANFGSQRYSQFPRVKRPDWGLYATVEDMGDEIMERYGEALGKALAKL